eukprot:m.28758 g.28758  ORF g.28758 m.28758 type:complete len:122 (-) comp11879_c0_seq1:88-453(-)
MKRLAHLRSKPAEPSRSTSGGSAKRASQSSRSGGPRVKNARTAVTVQRRKDHAQVHTSQSLPETASAESRSPSTSASMETAGPTPTSKTLVALSYGSFTVLAFETAPRETFGINSHIVAKQ